MMLDQWTAFKPGAEGGNLTDSSHGLSLTALTNSFGVSRPLYDRVVNTS